MTTWPSRSRAAADWPSSSGRNPSRHRRRWSGAVKNHKAGFVVSDSNVQPVGNARGRAGRSTETTGHSTIAVTEDGSPTGRLVGMVTGRDYRPGKHSAEHAGRRSS